MYDTKKGVLMEQLPLILMGVLLALTIVLTIVGIQMILVLIELKRTLSRVNMVIDAAEEKISNIINPLQTIGGAVSGVKTGLRVFEEFISWLQKNDKD